MGRPRGIPPFRRVRLRCGRGRDRYASSGEWTDHLPDGSGVLVHIGPAAYATWRATSLGAITERLEHRLILEMAGGVAGQRVLDVGCGDGALACTLARRGAEVVGVDPDPVMLEAARRRAVEYAIHAEFAEGHAECLPFRTARSMRSWP